MYRKLATIYKVSTLYLNFPCGSDGKESACNARDPGSIPGLGRSPTEGNGNPLQYVCSENPIDRGMLTFSAIDTPHYISLHSG